MILYGNAWFRTVATRGNAFLSMEIVHLTPSIPQAHGVAGLGPLNLFD